MSKRQLLRDLGWSDELADGFLGDFADTPVGESFEDYSEAHVTVSGSNIEPESLDFHLAGTQAIVLTDKPRR